MGKKEEKGKGEKLKKKGKKHRAMESKKGKFEAKNPIY